jgi:amphi-Trp domain-containing protein
VPSRGHPGEPLPGIDDGSETALTTPTRREFDYESLQDCTSVAEYLRALAEGFERGELALSDDSGATSLEPRGLVTFEIRASKKSERSRLTVTCRWRHRDERHAGEAASLTITTGRE